MLETLQLAFALHSLSPTARERGSEPTITERRKFTSMQRRKMGRGSTVLGILLISSGRKARDQGSKPNLMDLFNFQG
jgi:hypothetical protein